MTGPRTWYTRGDGARRGRRRRTRAHAAFTLVELIAVLTIVSVLSLTALPAIDALDDARSAGLAREVCRRLERARAHAASTGEPAGVTFDIGAQSLAMVRIADTGAAPTPLPGPTGAEPPAAADLIAAMFPGTSLDAVDLGAAAPTTTLWFAFDGTPHYRLSAGTFDSNITQAALITLSGGRTVTIEPVTGLVRR